MKDIEKIKSLSLVVLTSFGHCGADYVGNLFYGHNEILKIPALTFFRKIRILKIRKKIDLFKINRLDYLYKILKKFFFNSKLPSYKFFLNKKNEQNFKKYFFYYLKNDNEQKLEKKLFLAIHYSMAKAHGINFKGLKHILTHEHRSDYCSEYKKFFKNVKYLIVVRDPRATIAGTLKAGINSNISKEYQIDRAFSNWTVGYSFYLRENENKKLFLMQNEKFNGPNFKKIMKRVCLWLQIKFSKSLLKPKYFKNKWHGDSTYLGKKESIKPLPKNYYLIKNVKNRWLNQLSPEEISDIENLLKKSMNLFGYRPITRLSLFSYIMSYKNYLLGYKKNRTFFKNIYYSIKNIFRRLLILNRPNLAGKIFDII